MTKYSWEIPRYKYLSVDKFAKDGHQERSDVSVILGCTKNASKLIEKCFLDLRDMVSNQEMFENSSQNKKIYLAEKNTSQ